MLEVSSSPLGTMSGRHEWQLTGRLRLQSSAKYRSRNRVGNPSKELDALTAGLYQKVSGSREIGKYLDPANERSPSFKNLIKGIRRMEREFYALPREQRAFPDFSVLESIGLRVASLGAG